MRYRGNFTQLQHKRNFYFIKLKQSENFIYIIKNSDRFIHKLLDTKAGK